MPMDMRAVGNAASASKDATGLNGNEVFSGHVTIDRSDNGGFVVNVGYERQQQGGRRDQSLASFAPDRKLTFGDWASAQKVISGLYGVVGDEPDAAPDASPSVRQTPAGDSPQG